MLNNLIIWGTVIFFVLIVFYAGTIIVYAKKHKIDLATAIDKAQTELPLLTQIINLLEAALPTKYKTLATSIGDMITKGIGFAEQLNDAGMLTADQRKVTAMSMITAALKAEGIAPDDKTTAAISDAVDIAARVLISHKSNTGTQTEAVSVAAQAASESGAAADQQATNAANAAATAAADTQTAATTAQPSTDAGAVSAEATPQQTA